MTAGPTIWHAAPAREWLEAHPVGNGRLGAMVFGRLNKEMIGLNEETVWTRQNPDRLNPDAHEYLEQVRELLMKGDPLSAHFVAEYSLFGMPHYQATYQQLATLKLLTRDHHSEHATEYTRELDLQRGIARVAYTLRGVRHTREVFASAVDDVIVVHIGSDGDQPLEIALNLYRKQDAVGICLDDATLETTGRAGSRGSRFAAYARVDPGAGTVHAVGDHLHVSGADRISIVVGCQTDFRHEDFAAVALAQVDAASRRTFEDARADHVTDHAEAMSRVTLDLPTTAALAAEPTDVRLAAVDGGGSDPDLLATFFQFGRYLLLGSSRPGTLPANLQGIWNEHYISAWDSKFTININTEMNYWPAEVTALSECHDPLFDLLDRVQVSGAETARVHYGAGGYVAHHNVDLWADTAPLDNVNCGLWLTGGAWLALHTWDRFSFTLDRDFLRQRAYPALIGAAEFLLDVMVEGDDGMLLLGPTISPENGFMVDGVRVALCMSPAMDVQITRAVFDRSLEAAELLDIDDPILGRIREARDRLPPDRIGSDGRLLEWMEELEEFEPGHRHLSHLFGAYPDDQLLVDGDPELIDAVRRSLAARVDNMATSRGGVWGGWSAAWAVILWARLGEGDRAVELLDHMLRVSTSASLLDTSPPGGTNPLTVFQIDGNLGATAAIAEMLLQSHAGVIRVLPALPTAWPRGRVTGLRARGAVVVDIAWDEGRLVEATLTALTDTTVTIAVPSGDRLMSDTGDVTVVDGLATIEAVAGDVYTIHGGGGGDDDR